MKLTWYRRQMQRQIFASSWFRRINQGLSLAVAAGYGVMLLRLLWLGNWLRLSFAVAVPAVVFLLVGWLRKKWNCPRPFALLGISPLHPHEPGEGCPSRHTASAVILCWTALLMGGWSGWLLFGILLALALLIGAIRVFTGMHFLRDVLLGAGISSLFAAVCYLPLLWLHLG